MIILGVVAAVGACFFVGAAIGWGIGALTTYKNLSRDAQESHYEGLFKTLVTWR